MNSYIYKAVAAATGGFLALIAPIIPLLWVCFGFVIVDALSAYSLNKRVISQAKAKGATVDKDAHKFKTSKAYKVVTSMRDIAILLFLGHMLDTQVFGFFNGIYIANYIAGVFCVLQAWSILENSSSAHGSRWAKLLQKIMVDKTERHLDINLDDLKDENKE
jgi:hypothetical protein